MEPTHDPQPAEVASTCLMQAVRRASRALSAQFEAALAPVRLSATQFTILVALGVGSADSLTELGRRVGADRTTLSRLVTPLRQRGLVGPAAKRTGIALTDEGRAVLTAALPLWQAAQQRAVERLGGDAGTLRDLLSRF